MARVSDKYIVVELASAINTFLAKYALAVKHNAKEKQRYERKIKAAKAGSSEFADMAQDADDDESEAIFQKRSEELSYEHDQLEQSLALGVGMLYLDDLWKELYNSYKALRGQYVLEVGDNVNELLARIINAFDETSPTIKHNATNLWDCPQDTERALRKLRHIAGLIEMQKRLKGEVGPEGESQEPVKLRVFMEKYCVKRSPNVISSRVKSLQKHKDITFPKEVGKWSRGKAKFYHPDDLKKNWASYCDTISDLPSIAGKS